MTLSISDWQSKSDLDIILNSWDVHENHQASRLKLVFAPLFKSICFGHFGLHCFHHLVCWTGSKKLKPQYIFSLKKSDNFFSSNYCAVEISFLCYWSTISTRHILWALSLLLFFSIWSIFTQEPELTEKEVLGFAWQVNKMSIVRLIGWHKTDKKCKNCVQWSDENLPCIGTKEDDFLTFAFFWLVWQPLLYLFDWD